MLLFVKSALWKALFNKDADKLEQAADDPDTYYIIDSDPIICTFINADQSTGFNAMAFAAGITEAVLEGAGFPCSISAHYHKGTTLVIKFNHGNS